tara:strand:- start:2182 stop:2487 length:306 start_codon:yes stop_codon:yes gene_type:complete
LNLNVSFFDENVVPLENSESFVNFIKLFDQMLAFLLRSNSVLRDRHLLNLVRKRSFLALEGHSHARDLSVRQSDSSLWSLVKLNRHHHLLSFNFSLFFAIN